ncbi:hypothetical protein EV182_000828 [Spiromyces aspiralis]|uniref:Uncharacterized protein n=1 Tax=Spiromyces aspiralis TaxID=68401 RepID=A0ACC1I009_9FUNG|nr:hypothetical protein EV182_000828 [Spiromyces aspiralis]
MSVTGAQKDNEGNSKIDWGLDPLFWATAKLFIADIHAAEQTHLPVDDGTATITCIEWRFRPEGHEFESGKSESIPLNTLVCVVGKITEFRNQRQLKIRPPYPSVLSDPNLEALAWLERLEARRRIK